MAFYADRHTWTTETNIRKSKLKSWYNQLLLKWENTKESKQYQRWKKSNKCTKKSRYEKDIGKSGDYWEKQAAWWRCNILERHFQRSRCENDGNGIVKHRLAKNKHI